MTFIFKKQLIQSYNLIFHKQKLQEDLQWHSPLYSMDMPYTSTILIFPWKNVKDIDFHLMTTTIQ
jgi:hypothetical protein